MGDVWAGLAAGLGTASELSIKQYMQDLDRKLKEQEEENRVRRERELARYKSELRREETRAARAGTYTGSPVPSTEDGQYYALGWDEEGAQQSMRPVGDIPTGLLGEIKEERERKKTKEELQLENEMLRGEQIRSSTDLNRARAATAGVTGGGGRNAPNITPKNRIDADKRASEVAAAEFSDIVTSDGSILGKPKNMDQREYDDRVRAFRRRKEELVNYYLGIEGEGESNDEIASFFESLLSR